MPKRNAIDYKRKLAAIKTFISFKVPRKLGRGDKCKISRYFKRLAALRSRGYEMVKGGSVKGRAKANKIWHIGLKDLKGAMVPAPMTGGEGRVLADGRIVWRERSSGQVQTVVPCGFFPNDMEDLDYVINEEAKNIAKIAREALGHTPTGYAKAYIGGQGSTFTRPDLATALIFNPDNYGEAGSGRGKSSTLNYDQIAIGILAFYFKPDGNLARKVADLRARQRKRRAKARGKWGEQ